MSGRQAVALDPRRARAKRAAWVLAVAVIVVYVGVILWHVAQGIG